MHSQGSIFRYALALTMASLVAIMVGTTTALASHHSSSTTTSSATGAASRVDVNNADLKTLETLPGVGPALAKKIVSGRPYSSLSDLAQVKGMGQTKANALKHHVTFGHASGATTAKGTKKTHTKSSSRSTGSSSRSTRSSGSSGSSVSSGSSTAPSPTERSSPSSSEPSASSASSSHLAPGQTVDINTASAEELDKLPGIGPTKAQAIVDYRNEHGDFKSVDDIKNVRGIKEGTFSKIKDYITIGQ